MTTPKDSDLREALRRKYADTPQMPADFISRMHQASPDTPSRPMRCWLYPISAVAVAASVLLLIMLVVFGIMWFFMIRPQQKKQKEIRNFQNSLEKGAKVVTGGGIYGTVSRIDTETGKVEVEIAKGVVITVDRSYVFADSKALQPN